MELSEARYGLIEDCLPRQRGNISLPKHFGRWHTIYTRMSRWAKAGVLDRVFERLQREQILRLKIEVVSLGSSSVKVHPDGIGALKKTAPNPSANRAADGTPKSSTESVAVNSIPRLFLASWGGDVYPAFP